MVDELAGEIRIADVVADVLWRVVADGEADDADWFALARLITGQDDPKVPEEEAGIPWLNIVRPDLQDIADSDGKVSHAAMVQAGIQYLKGLVRLVAAGLPIAEGLFAQIDEVRSMFAAVPNDPERLEALLIRVRDLSASRQLLHAMDTLCTTHPLLRDARRPKGTEEEILATYRARSRAATELTRLREELDELPD